MSSLKRGRTTEHERETPSTKRIRTGNVTSSSSRASNTARSYKPRLLYGSHPHSGVGKDFHSLPYPLDKLPKQSWQTLNQGDEEGAICAKCAKPRPSTPHQRKLFLVAERLSWETGATPSSARSQNEIALWAVNAKFDIFDPAVEDEDIILGGKRSRENPCYPFKSDEEAEFAMRIVAKAEILTPNSWEVWKSQLDAILNPPPAKASTGPGSAAEPLELSSYEPETAADQHPRTSLDNKQQANAVYKLLREWSKTDTVLKSVMDGMEKKITIAQHGAQISNGKVEAAMKAIRSSSDASGLDVARAAQGESPAVLEFLSARARNEPDFRALVMAVSKGVATAQTDSLFKSHVMAARKAASDTRPPLQDVSPNSMAQKSKGKAKAVEVPASPAATKKICSYQTLQDFYSLLDKIERTSPMGAKYLEAYAERLHGETCKDCWFNMNVLPELKNDEPGPLSATEPSALHQRTSLAGNQAPRSRMDNYSHAQGYVDRYRAQYGQDPPQLIMAQHASNVPPRSSVASQDRLLPASSSQPYSAAAARQIQNRAGTYKAQHGLVPSPHLVRVAHTRRPGEAVATMNTPPSGRASHAHPTLQPPALQQHGQLPTDIVFPTPEQLGLPPAPQALVRARGTPQRTYVSPYQPSSLPPLPRKGRR